MKTCYTSVSQNNEASIVTREGNAFAGGGWLRLTAASGKQNSKYSADGYDR